MPDNSWTLENAQEVTVGDVVALSAHPDATGRIVGVTPSGLPAVNHLNGPYAGRILETPVGEMFCKSTRSTPANA